MSLNCIKGSNYNINEYDFELPEELIAQEPLSNRDESKLMLIKTREKERKNLYFKKITDLLNEGDLLVLNNTRVIPARLKGINGENGSSVEFLLLRKIASLKDNKWEVMVKPGKRAMPGNTVIFNNGIEGFIEKTEDSGYRVVTFTYNSNICNDKLLFSAGEVPLPPYIKKMVDDPESYQTVYSKVAGSVAAPTAGLHFTENIFNKLAEKGVKKEFITLHIGPGTFSPVRSEDIRNHDMHEEYYEITEKTAKEVNDTRRKGKKVIAVGTTSCRVLESMTDGNRMIKSGFGWTDIFIYPGYKFKCIDGLLTNFHLPRSTLFMLVSALAGTDFMKESYGEAVDKGYRFFSFGDAMLII